MIVYNTTVARDFAAWLENATDELHVAKQTLNDAFAAMNGNWSDRKYEAYLAELVDMLLALEVSLIHARRYVGYLRQRADLVDSFLDGQ